MRRALLLLSALGCASEVGPSDAGLCATPAPVLDPDQFALTPEASDPFRVAPMLDAATTSSLARGRCGPLDVKPELLGGTRSFSITTLFCSWGTAEARSLRAVSEGEKLTARVWHFSHLKIERAEADVLLAHEDRVIWRAKVALPSEGALLDEELRAPFAIPAGARILWHVQNHGQNSWNFLTLEAEALEPCAGGGG